MLTKTPSRLLSKHATRGHKRSAQPADIALGDAVRLKRLDLGMSQSELGELIGVTFQQVQKYENGTNRVSGSRLVQMAHALHT